MAYPSDPYHNTYECPECSDDVSVPLPMAKYITCPSCKSKLEIMVDADFENGMWHDRTELALVDEEEAHIERMIDHHKKVGECEHKYTEQTTAPLGVKCLKCGHFEGAWE